MLRDFFVCLHTVFYPISHKRIAEAIKSQTTSALECKANTHKVWMRPRIVWAQRNVDRLYIDGAQRTGPKSKRDVFNLATLWPSRASFDTTKQIHKTE